MTLIEIENMAAGVINERSAELIAEAAKATPVELADRFVWARYDAKLRDEKLAEQGKTIQLFQKQLDDAGAKIADLLTRLDSARDAAVLEQGAAAASQQELKAVIATLESELAESKARTDLLGSKLASATSLAKARRVGLADVMKVVAPLLVQE